MKVSDKVSTAENMDSVSKTKAAHKKGKAGHTEGKGAEKVLADDLGSAKVNLSDRANDMKKIKDVVAKTPDVDEDKVAKYKSMIAKGEYKVDAKKVADKMVDEHAYQDFFNGEE